MARGLCAEGHQELAARALTPPTFLRAQAAMLVVAGVALALLGTRATCSAARLDCGYLSALGRAGPATDDIARATARVRAAEAQLDAAGQCTDVVLGQAGIHADRAGGRALATFAYAPHEHRKLGDGRSGGAL